MSDATDAIAPKIRRAARPGPQHQGRGGGVGALDQEAHLRARARRHLRRAGQGAVHPAARLSHPRTEVERRAAESTARRSSIRSRPRSRSRSRPISRCFAPGGYGQKHGHMNSAVFYVLKGKGHDVHDGRRLDWEAGDALIVENACVHQHFSDDPDDECDRAGHEGEAAVPVHAHDVPEGRGISAQGRRAPAQRRYAPPTGSVRRLSDE